MKYTYTKILNQDISLKVMTNSLPTKGKLVYEYNPFRNYRLSESKYWFRDEYYSEDELKNLYNIFIDKRKSIVSPDTKEEVDNPDFLKKWINVPPNEADPVLYEKGLLVDFVTDELHFSLDHPVHILPQYSYDGSVNLIINDGLNIPRLINSRFSVTGKNTYEIIDRKGDNDTNIYDLGDLFNIDTSLYKRVKTIPTLNFKGVFAGGNLKVGNYHFYFKYSDADGNETDFVAESGLVSVFMGFDTPRSVHTGVKDLNSTKQIQFILSNIDDAYDYVTVYYSRYSSELNQNPIISYMKIDKKFNVNNANFVNIIITGFEKELPISPDDINLYYNIVDSTVTSTICQNMLFMANVHKPDIPYKELEDLSLRFLPYLKEVPYNVDEDEDYNITSTSKGYIDPKFIYYNTGYWGKELYRFGIVYILPNNELSPVFNIRGRENVGVFNPNNNIYNSITDSSEEWLLKIKKLRKNTMVNDGLYSQFFLKLPIKVKEDSNYVLDPEKLEGLKANYNKATFENNKGVVSFDPKSDTNKIYALDVRVEDEVILELKKYVKGYFFVRLKRIPTILALGITIGLDKHAHTPTIPTKEGILDELKNSTGKTHVLTTFGKVNYISEGFLDRYTFRFAKKTSSVWGKIGKIFAVTALVAAVVAGSVLSFGGGAIAFGFTSGVGSLVGAGTWTGAVVAASAAVGLAGGAATAAIVSLGGAVENGIYSILRKNSEDELKVVNGRKTKAPKGFKIVEAEVSRKIGGSFEDRIIMKDSEFNDIKAVLCPEYNVNLELYNSIFTGNTHILRTTISLGTNFLKYPKDPINFFTNYGRHFYIPGYTDVLDVLQHACKIVGIPDNVKIVGFGNNKYRSRAGSTEEAWTYELIGCEQTESKNIKINSDIIRGSFGPYLGIDQYPERPAETVDIMIPGYNSADLEDYIQLRANDKSIFTAISDRFDILKLDSLLNSPMSAILDNLSRECGYHHELYRGDCYICQVSERIIRNFNDPTAPYNDVIVDNKSWKDNYDPDKQENYNKINSGDVNAAELGMWVTFRVRATNNLNIRTLDDSYIEEKAMSGNSRGYYPQIPMSTEGSYKMPESTIYNKGFQKSTSERWNFELPDVPYIKNWFGTRIMFSDVHINDAYKNGFRVFLGANFKDYTREYGEIVKLITIESNILCVFEHGIALMPVKERVLSGDGAGGLVYINSSKVLPDAPKIISDMYGSQWPESILKVPGKTGNKTQLIYGVDTVAKKIWRTDGNTLECISDFKVQSFLNNNITLGERELTPKIGIRNVKTVYNAFKLDVMFTFYDNTYGFEEKVWNLCYNEILLKFITFYSWVPSYMENINNIPFSFDRNVSKWIAKLGASNTFSDIADGITVTNNIINNSFETKTFPLQEYEVEIKPIENICVDDYSFPLPYVTTAGKIRVKRGVIYAESRDKFIGVLDLSNRFVPDNRHFYNIHFSLEHDPWGNYKNFEIRPLYGKTGVTLRQLLNPNEMDAKYPDIPIHKYALYFKDPKSDWTPVYGHVDDELVEILADNNSLVELYTPHLRPESLFSELYYRNKEGHRYPDYDVNKTSWQDFVIPDQSIDWKEIDLPIFKDITGKRVPLDRKDMLNPDKIVTYLNIKASIELVIPENSSLDLTDSYRLLLAGYASGTTLMDLGLYESVVAITPKWNLQFLSSDFWKHGQAGIIDIADTIYPTYWYGKQHPFEFEFIVVNDPAIHKIFSNLELVANKAKPESFHYEVIGESYDFAKDKPNMYFRQEAIKALWLYNGADILYNRNFLTVPLRQQAKSADLIHLYYTRLDTFNEVEDYYLSATNPASKNYNHLSGGEVVYYPNRQEFRIWNHTKAVDLNDLSLDDSRSIIAANCQYLEDRWKVTINPLLVCYKNEYKRKFEGEALILPKNSSWVKAAKSDLLLPPLSIYNSPIPEYILKKDEIRFPGDASSIPDGGEDGLVPLDKPLAHRTDDYSTSNALYELYDLSLYNPMNSWKPLDLTNWLDGDSFGSAQNRKEVDLRDKFIKIRIRYSGKELAIIDFLNTVYRISYA